MILINIILLILSIHNTFAESEFKGSCEDKCISHICSNNLNGNLCKSHLQQQINCMYDNKCLNCDNIKVRNSKQYCSSNKNCMRDCCKDEACTRIVSCIADCPLDKTHQQKQIFNLEKRSAQIHHHLPKKNINSNDQNQYTQTIQLKNQNNSNINIQEDNSKSSFENRRYSILFLTFVILII